MSDSLLTKGPIRRRLAARRATSAVQGGRHAPGPSDAEVELSSPGIGEEEEERERSLSGVSSGSHVGSEEEPRRKPWQKASREVYEEQLEHLQAQLMDSMLHNQALQGEGAWHPARPR